MKIIATISLIILSQGSVLLGQNLVTNGSFEQVSTCNVTNNQESISATSLWYPINSPDFFNTCFIEPTLAPPITWAGISDILDGDGFAGIAMTPNNNYREGIGIALNSALIKDSAYCISFYTKNSVAAGYQYSTDMISVVFGNGTVPLSSFYGNSSQLFNKTHQDGNEWQKFDAVYIANGTEDNFGIGFLGNYNFSHEASNVNDQLLYYFIDSVELKMCNRDSVFQIQLDLPNVFTPNNDNINDFYIPLSHNLIELRVSIFNRWGNEVIRFDGLSESWNGKSTNGSLVSEGVYFISATGIDYLGQPIYAEEFITVTY